MPRNTVATRKRILTAAYRLFYRRGYVRVTMDDISAAAHITKRSVHHHFKSKDDLVRAALQDQQAHILPLIQKWVREQILMRAAVGPELSSGRVCCMSDKPPTATVAADIEITRNVPTTA